MSISEKLGLARTPKGTQHAPKTRRTLSGKAIPAETPKRSWQTLVHPSVDDLRPEKPEPPETVDVVIRKRKSGIEGRRRDVRAAMRLGGGDPSLISEDTLHRDVPTWEVSGQARAHRRRTARIRARAQRKGQRAFNRDQDRIAKDNANIEHLIEMAGGQIPGIPLGSPAAQRAEAALQARAKARGIEI